MRKILINYANGMYINSQRNNSRTGLEVGGFDEVRDFNYGDIDDDFKIKNQDILSQNRGAGYWIWKPYFILKVLDTMSENDILFYCDSGSFFVGDFNDYLFQKCFDDKNGLILFNGNHINYKFTKRDCFFYMGCDEKEYVEGNHLTASFQLVRKTDFTLNFYNEHLKYSTDYRISTDRPNECGYENYEGFIDHRHDQSILSLLAIKYKVNLMEDISQYGNNYRESQFKQLIDHNRNKN
jgi:hypothetical protein